MKLIGFLLLALGAFAGGVAGYFVALENQPRPRVPTDIAYTILPDFDLKKVMDTIVSTEKDKKPIDWKIVKDTPGKRSLEDHRKFLQDYKQGRQEHSAQVLGIKSRVIVAQAKIAADEQVDYWKALQERLAASIVDLKIDVSTPGSGGRTRAGNADEKAQDVRTAYLEYLKIPGDRSPYPMRGAMHVAWVSEGDLVSLVITLTEIFITT